MAKEGCSQQMGGCFHQKRLKPFNMIKMIKKKVPVLSDLVKIGSSSIVKVADWLVNLLEGHKSQLSSSCSSNKMTRGLKASLTYVSMNVSLNDNPNSSLG